MVGIGVTRGGRVPGGGVKDPDGGSRGVGATEGAGVVGRGAGVTVAVGGGGATGGATTGAGAGARYTAGAGGPLFRSRVRVLTGETGTADGAGVWAGDVWAGDVWAGDVWAGAAPASSRAAAAAGTRMFMETTIPLQPANGKAPIRRPEVRPRRWPPGRVWRSRRSSRPAVRPAAWPGPGRYHGPRRSSARGPGG